jgi:hypothetical protein
MKNALKKFVLQNVVLSIALYGLGYFIMYQIFNLPNLRIFPYMIAMFFIISNFSHYLLLKKVEKKPNSFVNTAMILTTGKLMFYLAFVLIYILVNKSGHLQFVLSFFGLYTAFTILEVSKRLSEIKNQKQA